MSTVYFITYTYEQEYCLTGVRTTVALLSVAVVALFVGVVVSPVAFFILVVLVFVHLLFMNDNIGHLRRKWQRKDKVRFGK